MKWTVEAIIYEDGAVWLLEQVNVPTARRALVTILDEEPVFQKAQTALVKRNGDSRGLESTGGARGVVVPTTQRSLLNRIRSRISDPKRTTDMVRWQAPQLFSPASLAVVRAAEQQFGFSFPPLLTAIFTKIGNGGFGPGYGLLGIEGSPYASEYGYDPDLGKLGLLGTYAEWSSYGDSPKQLIPLCHWGCGLWSCVDCLQTNHPVVYVGGASGDYVIHHDTFTDWITAWLEDENLFERGENATELWTPIHK